MKSLSRVRLFTTPWTAAHQAPPSMGFFRQEYWSGVPLPSLRGFGNQAFSRCNTSNDQQGELTPWGIPAWTLWSASLKSPAGSSLLAVVDSTLVWPRLVLGFFVSLRAVHSQPPHLSSPCLCPQHPLLLPLLVIRPWASVLTSLSLRPLCAKVRTITSGCEDSIRL